MQSGCMIWADFRLFSFLRHVIGVFSIRRTDLQLDSTRWQTKSSFPLGNGRVDIVFGVVGAMYDSMFGDGILLLASHSYHTVYHRTMRGKTY
ncbi:hypothetical protein DICVIV_00732 [Dictyocaulus viviparus]|uniref:Uncharacterized protein n=1 Tax=Dictyocaulus viviparus TaxID=29172 RepID=A0A0D8YA15_DICVI|nr:hypothetical protein DICVIV_00732 [Dictyocaulus viviparus]